MRRLLLVLLLLLPLSALAAEARVLLEAFDSPTVGPG